MTAPTRITIDELRRALLLVLDAVEKEMGAVVDLDGEQYWQITDQAAYNLVTDPENHLVIAHLSDDVEEIRDLLARPGDEYLAIWHEIGHLSGVLRRIGSLTLSGGG